MTTFIRAILAALLALLLLMGVPGHIGQAARFAFGVVLVCAVAFLWLVHISMEAAQKKSELESLLEAHLQKADDTAQDSPPHGTGIGEPQPAYIRTPIAVTPDGGEDEVTNIGTVEKGARDAGNVEFEVTPRFTKSAHSRFAGNGS